MWNPFKKSGTTYDYLQQAIEAKRQALAKYETARARYLEKESQLLYDESADKDSTPFGAGFTLQDMQTTYGISAWVYRCITVIAQNAATVKKIIKDADSGEIIDNHPLLPLLNQRPNPLMSAFEFYEQLYSFLDLIGDFFCELVSKENGEIIDLVPMRPDKVKIKASKTDYVTGYEYSIGDMTVKLEPRDVIHGKYFNPYDEYWGLSPLSAAKIALETDIYAAMWNKRFFQEGAIPRGYITVPGTPSKEEINRIKSDWRKKHKGLKQQDIAVITNEGKIEVIGATQSDMEFLNQRRFSREEILAIYGVPPSLAGIFQFSTTSARSAGAEQQMKLFWEETILPRLRKLDDAFTLAFQERGMSIVVESDLKKVQALRRDVKETAQIARLAIQSGLTLNEVRERIWEEEPIGDDGDIIFLPANLMPMAEDIEERVEEQITEDETKWLEHIRRYKRMAAA